MQLSPPREKEGAWFLAITGTGANKVTNRLKAIKLRMERPILTFLLR